MKSSTSISILLFLTLVSISMIAGMSVVVDLINQVFLLRTAINWINFCSAILCIIFFISKMNSKHIFILNITLSAHQFYLLEKIIDKPHYRIFPDSQWYINSSKELLLDYKQFLTIGELPDLGFTSIIALNSAIFNNIDIINYSLMIVNIVSVSLAFILMISLLKVSARDKRLVSILMVFFPGIQIFPAFMLKESIFCLIISVVFYLYYSKKSKFLSYLSNTIIIFFRPFYALIIMLFLLIRRKPLIITCLLVGLFFVIYSQNPLINWAKQIWFGLYGSPSIDIIVKNFILAFFFPFPSVQAEGNLLTAVYSYGSIVFYTFLPFYITVIFTRKFPSELRYIFFAVCSAMFVLGIGLFRAKIVLMPIFIIWLVMSTEMNNFDKPLRFAAGYIALAVFSSMLFMSNF